MRAPAGVHDLLHSERGAFCLLALLAATALVVFGSLTGTAWVDFVKYLVGFLVASKTVTTAVEVATTKKPQIPDPPSPEVPTARVVKEG